MGIYFLCLVLFSLGVWCLFVKKNLIKKIIGLAITEYAINLFFILLGYKIGADAPILEKNNLSIVSVDPLPQALILTSIVIGLGIIAFSVSLVMRLYEKYKTFDINKINNLKG